MPLPDINDIVKRYKSLGIKQKELAKAINEDVTWLNKVVKGKNKNPTYRKMKKIYDYIEKKADEGSTTTGDICAHPVTMIKLGGKSILQVSRILQKKKFTQAPVTKRDKVIGMITSGKLNEFLGQDVRNIRLNEAHLLPAPSRVPHDYPAKSVKALVGYSKCVLVEKHGKIYGIITEEDLFKLF
jgi:predicted transcriptional regulator